MQKMLLEEYGTAAPSIKKRVKRQSVQQRLKLYNRCTPRLAGRGFLGSFDVEVAVSVEYLAPKAGS